MNTKRFFLSLLAASSLGATTGPAHAALTVYTSQAAFLAAVVAPGVDTFAGLSVTGSTASPLLRSAGPYAYTATSTSVFYGAGTPANPWLSTDSATDSITFSNFGSGVSAVAGLFFGSDVSGAFASGTVQLVATDSLGAMSTQTIANATVTSFLGFASTGTMTSLVLTAASPNASLFPTADNLTLAAVPEPGSWALLLAGLGLFGVARLRSHWRQAPPP